jgi:hypothetical protein
MEAQKVKSRSLLGCMAWCNTFEMQKRKWAEEAVQSLQAGKTVNIRPIGLSMQGKVSDGDLVTLAPCLPQDLVTGDIVLARIKGRRYFHLVLHLIIERKADKFLIGNNHGRVDEWVSGENIYGKATKVHASTNAANGSS